MFKHIYSRTRNVFYRAFQAFQEEAKLNLLNEQPELAELSKWWGCPLAMAEQETYEYIEYLPMCWRLSDSKSPSIKSTNKLKSFYRNCAVFSIIGKRKSDSCHVYRTIPSMLHELCFVWQGKSVEKTLTFLFREWRRRTEKNERATKHTYFAAACISFHIAPLICLRCVPTSPSTTIELPISARKETSFSWRASCVKGVGFGVGWKIQGSHEAKPNNRSVSCDIIYACERLIRFRVKVRRCLLHTRGLSIIKGRWLELTNDEAWHVKLRFVGLRRRTQISRHIAQLRSRLWPLISRKYFCALKKSRRHSDISIFAFARHRVVVRSFGDYVTIVYVLLTMTVEEESKTSPFSSPRTYLSPQNPFVSHFIFVRRRKSFLRISQRTKNTQVFFFSK